MRRYCGDSFDLLIPEEWSDRTTPALAGPWVHGDRGGFTVQHEDRAGSDLERFAAERIARALAAPSRWELLGQHTLTGDGGETAIMAELGWAGESSGRPTLFRRLLCRLVDGAGITITCQVRTPSRRLLGGAVGRMALSLMPVEADQAVEAADSPVPRPRPAGRFQGGRFRADRFTLDLYPGWMDASLYHLGRRNGAELSPNLIVRQQPLDETGWTAETFCDRARAETEQMRATIPGFELIEEGELELTSRVSVPLREFTRAAAPGRHVRQVQILLAGDGRLFTLCHTADAEEESAAARELLAGFRLVHAPILSVSSVGRVR